VLLLQSSSCCSRSDMKRQRAALFREMFLATLRSRTLALSALVLLDSDTLSYVSWEISLALRQWSGFLVLR